MVDSISFLVVIGPNITNAVHKSSWDCPKVVHLIIWQKLALLVHFASPPLDQARIANDGGRV